MRVPEASAKYSLIPQSDDEANTNGNDLEEDRRRKAEAVIDRFKGDNSRLATREKELQQEIRSFNDLWQSRRQPLDEELEAVRKRMEELDYQLKRALESLEPDEMPEAQGPKFLSWVDGMAFHIACNLIVVLNLAAMILGPNFPSYKMTLKVCDNIFLVWYVMELGVKMWYHQSNLFVGKVSVVWWNWLDLLIVLSGIADQWLMGLVMVLSGSGPAGATSALRAVKFLRFLRMLRILKFIRAFLASDTTWTEGHSFEIFMSGVIASNAIVMSLELDINWGGWLLVENAFMIIYTFELIMKLKRQGCAFMLDSNSMLWNYLDIILVIGGALDLWLLPSQRYVESLMGNEPSANAGGDMSKIMSLLRLMRIMRVLRLVRLLKAIKPLYRLLLGVIESLKAMQWVMVLTLLMLYAGAIFWTSLVGKGLLYGGHPPPDGIRHFGNVPTSLFSLFRIMNGDTSVVKSVTSTVFGQLLFAVFMVLSNWAILAILTSVVSDNMISASQKAAEEDAERDKAEEYQRKVGRLNVLFREIDQDCSGSINEEEWNAVCNDAGLFHDLSEATNYTGKDLHDLFKCLAVSKMKIDSAIHDEGADDDMNTMFFIDFLEHLRNDASPADKRSVLQIMAKMQHMERNLERQIHDIWSALSQVPELQKSFQKTATTSKKDATRRQLRQKSATMPAWRKGLSGKHHGPITKL